MTTERKTGAFSKARFDWKKEVFASHTLSRGAILLAASLCDSYLNKHSGCCWSKNKTFAQNLSHSKRSVQRHMGELIDCGWLQHVNIVKKSPALQISFPSQTNVYSEYDSLSSSRMPSLAIKHAKTVTLYKNQERNKGKRQTSCQDCNTVLVGNRKEHVLDGWKRWLEENTDYKTETIFDLLRKHGGNMFPVRIPKEEHTQRYHTFIRVVFASNGFDVSDRLD